MWALLVLNVAWYLPWQIPRKRYGEKVACDESRFLRELPARRSHLDK